MLNNHSPSFFTEKQPLAVQTDFGDGVYLRDYTFQFFQEGQVPPLTMPVGAHANMGLPFILANE